MDTSNKIELITINKELVFQIQQIEKLVTVLLTNNKKLMDQCDESKKCNTELAIVNKEIISKNKETEKQSVVLLKKNEELKKAEESQKQYIHGLESILFMTSHRIRQPITNILGLSYLLDEFKNTNNELKVFIDFIKQSALTLDVYTQELTAHTFDLKQKVQIKNTT